jgi:hypothetical protein
MLAHYFQVQEEELRTKVVTDPRAAVSVGVASLRAIPGLPGAWLVSGLVYDVATGLAEIVVPPAPTFSPCNFLQRSFHLWRRNHLLVLTDSSELADWVREIPKSFPIR